MILLDTNIFLELLLGREGAPDCENLLQAISKGTLEATATHFTIHAVEAVLRNEESITTFLRNLENSQGLYVYDTSITEEIATAMISKHLKRDFDDTLQYYVARKLGAEAIISYDKHLDGLDLPRVEPAEALQQRRRRKKTPRKPSSA